MGASHAYEPDYLVRPANGHTLVLEIKGMETEQDKAKHQGARRWVSAVSNWGKLGRAESPTTGELFHGYSERMAEIHRPAAMPAPGVLCQALNLPASNSPLTPPDAPRATPP